MASDVVSLFSSLWFPVFRTQMKVSAEMYYTSHFIFYDFLDISLQVTSRFLCTYKCSECL